MFTKRRMFHVAVLSVEHFLVRGFDVNVQHICYKMNTIEPLA